MIAITSDFLEIAIKIIREQEFIIGSLAWDEARKVQGLQIIDAKNGKISIENSDPKKIINNLVAQYERIFGRASHEVSKDAVRSIVSKMPVDEVPVSLR